MLSIFYLFNCHQQKDFSTDHRMILISLSSQAYACIHKKKHNSEHTHITYTQKHPANRNFSVGTIKIKTPFSYLITHVCFVPYYRSVSDNLCSRDSINIWAVEQPLCHGDCIPRAKMRVLEFVCRCRALVRRGGTRLNIPSTRN